MRSVFILDDLDAKFIGGRIDDGFEGVTIGGVPLGGHIGQLAKFAGKLHVPSVGTAQRIGDLSSFDVFHDVVLSGLMACPFLDYDVIVRPMCVQNNSQNTQIFRNFYSEITIKAVIHINKWEKEVQQSLLDSEEAAIKELEKQYARALKDITDKVKSFQADIDLLDQALSQDGLDDATKALLQSQKQSKVYQQNYQKALKGQVSGVLDKLHGDNYATIDKYLKSCYETGYIGTMYDIAKQGVPIIAPIDQAAAVKAILTDSKIVEGYYNHLGVNYDKLKKTITQEISRGIASGLTYSDIARNINNVSSSGLYNAKRIARTEGHRIQQTSSRDAQYAAKKKGCDVVKQWDASLDGRTRDSHARVDGEIRELDEKFSNGLMFPGDPSGSAAEVINCRCTSNTRARWALDDGELQTLKERAEYFGIDKADNFEDFKNKYLKSAEQSAKMEAQNFTPAKTIKEAEAFARDKLGLECSYKGVDLQCANDMNAAFQRGLDYCPAIKDRLNFVGSGQERNRRFKKEMVDYYLDDLKNRYPGQTDAWYNKYAKTFANKAVGRIDGRTYAFASRSVSTSPDVVKKYTGIVVNNKWGENAEMFISALESDVKTSWHPTGCGTIASVFDHEIAHQIDYATGLRDNQAMKTLWGSLSKEDIEKGLSRYGASNIAEFIAEGYAEYCNSEKPREIASKIGSIIEKAVGKT